MSRVGPTSTLPPTKVTLSEVLLQEEGTDPAPVQRIVRRQETADIPLSFAQQRLWLLDRLNPGGAPYNIPLARRLSGPLNTAALEQRLNEIIRRHEVLRTTFLVSDGRPVQVIATALTVSLPVIDLRELPAADREAEAQRLTTREAQRPFDLARGPLVRPTVLRLGDADHVLLLSLHHIVSDGWSMDVLFQELVTLYGAFCVGWPSPLPELPIQYADYAVWQRQRWQGGELDAQVAYWKQRLAGAPPALELPTDRPRPSVQTYHGARHAWALPALLSSALHDVSRQEGVTPFMTLLAAFQALLHRHTGQTDIVVGSPIAARNQPELEGLIGACVNTLSLRTDLSGNPTFRELLGRVREVVLGAHAHQELPFEKLLEELRPERNLSRSPLFQVTFTLQNFPPPLELPGVVMHPLDVHTDTAKFDLSLELRQESEGVNGWFEYNTDLFEAATIARMAGHFQALLEGIVTNPDQRLAALPLLTHAERRQLSVEWNNTSRDYPQAVCLHQLFEAQVDRSPEAVAVVFDSEHLTYNELNCRANQVAHYLRKRGIGPEVCVGVFMERSLEMLIGIYGILKAGGAYVPLDPEYPPERLAFMLQDSQVPVLLTQKRLVPQLPRHNAQVVCVDADWTTIARESTDNPRSGVSETNAAYVIYTSGSTGRPKGVLNSHQGVCNRLLWMQEEYRLTAADRVLQKTPFSFDVSVWELFWPLLVGSRLIVAQPGGHRDNAYLVNLIVSQGVTTLHFVPPMLQLFLEQQDVGRCQSLRRVMCSGEALPYELQARFFARLPMVELHNLYGPTEAAIDVTYWACQPQSTLPVVPIGRPVANTQLYILDPHLQPVPIGVRGELHIGGVQVARGYLNRPELTAEKFIPDPFSPDPGARLYRTGDSARYWPDGNIEFLGRIDNQVKIRGFRVELGEIEAVLGQHPEVRENVVTVREDPPGDKHLVAYVVPHQGRNPTTSALQRFLREQLPEYMVPAVFVPLQAMPLTPNGKVDRRALPAPGPSRPALEQVYVAPQTPLEQFLARLWCEVLKLDRVGIHDNFFDLGGDSIHGAIFINRLQQHLQDPLYIVALFDSPTVAAFAAFLATYYGDAVSRLLGAEAHPRHIPAQGAAALARERRVDAAMLEQMRQLIVPLAPHASGEDRQQEKNPQAIFILAPFRSGTTLLRVMLAGHPRLFAPAELQLLGFNTLGERRAAFSGKYRLWLEGTIRTVMQIQGCDADQAKCIMARYEDQDMTTKQFYRVLQDWIAPKTLVDKSPLYALDLATLKRAECDFEDALYIHLVRHPYAMVRSFERHRMEQVLFMPEQPFSARELGELVWVISHQNIAEFLDGVPEGRKYRIRFEELTHQPRAVMAQMCRKFGLEYHPDLIEPYKDKERKMTDGIYAVSAPMGDTKFNDYQGIDPRVAEGWKEVMRDNFLAEVTWEWAERLGYERVCRQAAPDEWRPLRAGRYVGSARGPEARTGRPPAEVGAPGGGMLRTGYEGDTMTMVGRPHQGDGGAKSVPLSFAQERLWFLDQLTPGTAVYNLPAAMRLRGALDRSALEVSLDEIVRRHEVLRTCFVAMEGKPVQMIAPGTKLAVTVIDLSPMPEAERAEEMQRLASEEARRPFNLGQGPLVRAMLLRLSDQEHVLLLTLHHIVSDAWSRGVFNHELKTLYEAFAAGRPSPLPALPVQYADYVVWQREWLRGAVLERQLQYWRQQLAGVPVLELPCDHPRPSMQTYQGARAAFRLPKRLSARLTAFSRRENVTLYMTLLAAFQTLLARYTGQDDIAVGSPIAGRNRAEFEGLIGFFVNTLVMRSDLSGDPTFRELLGRVREVALGAYAHQELPFERLVEELAPVRSLSHSPLFQVMFVLQNAPKQTLELSALGLEPMEVDNGTSKFDLTLFMNEEDEGLSGQLEYNTDLFEAETVRRMLGHFEVLLEGIAADPARRLSELPLLPEAERRQLLVDWNRTEADYPRACLHELFERQAARTPGAVALIDEGERLTYAELNARANQLARYLQRLGVGPEVPVGICVERSPDVVVGLLGILKAGGAYVPLDPAYPEQRLAFMLEDAAVHYVLTQERLRASLPWHGAEVVCLDADRALFAQEGAQDLGMPMTPEHAAYVMYTSGSTGTPKGVVGLHRGALNRFQWMWKKYPFAPYEVCCQKTALSFVDSVWEIFGPLLQGTPLLMVRDHVVKDPAQLVQHLAAHHVSRITLVPSLLRAILDVVAQSQETLPDLKFWVSSGEPLLPGLARRFLDLLPHALLINLYGSSEVAADVTWYEVGHRDSRAPSVPIGRPFANTQTYVLDQHGNPVPVGVIGELYAGGANVARGYLNRPELTAEKFVPDPFGPEPGGRLYRTGDLARYRPDGTLEYLGRIDHQVKVRGYRIELGEVEAVLREQAGVREAVVVARPGMPGEQRLVAYVVPARVPGPAISELRDFVKAQLPDYMVPSAFVLLGALPLTPSGKVDRRALPAPEVVRPELDATYVAPRTPVEEVLVGIWSEVLGLKQVGIDDNFFALGGHSLLAAQVMSRLRDAFHIELPLRAFFEAPTVAGQALAIAQRRAAQTEHGELARMLAELEGLSEDEARGMCRKF
jgi:amino acid adenylation domain-containing protein